MSYELAVLAALTLRLGIDLTKNGIKRMIPEIAKLTNDSSINEYSIQVTDQVISEQSRRIILLLQNYRKKKGSV